MIHAYRYRIYPNEAQKAYFAKAFGCTRYAYNFYVREHERAWKEEGKTLYEFGLENSIGNLRDEKSWLAEADSSIFFWSADRVVRGYDRFFDFIQNKDNDKNSRVINKPHEHKKGERSYQSYTTSGRLKVYFKQNLIQLPIVGLIKAKLHRRFFGEIKHVTVKQLGSGQYYASLCVDERKPQPPMKPFDKGNALGIDVGVRHFLTLSDGTHIEMPDVSKAQKRKAFYQARLKHQKMGSKRYNETKKKIARLSEHIANIRLDFHHKTAAKLCSKYSAICMETINAEGMRRNVGEKKDPKDTGFNRKLNHVGLGQFSRILEEKAKNTGTNFNRVDRWEPTTKRCHVCGYVNKDITLDTTEWTCPQCGTHHDRDVNAAINIKNHAASQQPEPVKEDKPLDAELIAKQLPLVGGKVLPATRGRKSASRTGKVTGKNICQPLTQIEDGTTHPRLANELEAIKYVRFKRVAMQIGLSYYDVERCMKGRMGLSNDGVLLLCQRLHKLAKECRNSSIRNNDRAATTVVLLKMNKLIFMDKISEDLFHHGKPFTWWRSLTKTDDEIKTINHFYTHVMPDQIDKLVELLKRNIS